jgi:hypothetical protein
MKDAGIDVYEHTSTSDIDKMNKIEIINNDDDYTLP